MAMTRLYYFLPLGGLVVFAGYVGLRAGDVPGETEIINRYASTYVDTLKDGAAVTDCAATSHPNGAVRMVITCTHPSGIVTNYYVGPRGNTIPADQIRMPDA